MSGRFWRFVDALLPGTLREADPELRARARLLLAFFLLTAVAGLGMAPLDAIFHTVDPVISAMAVAGAFVFALVFRWTGSVSLVAVLYVVALAFVSAGMSAVDPRPDGAYMAWALVLGFTPPVGPSLVVNLAIVATAVGLCFVFQLPPPTEPGIVAPGDVFFMVMAAWFGMVFVLDTHQMAVSEQAAAHAAQRDRERAIDAASRALALEARDTLTFMTTVSHELRTPLNGVLGLTSLIADEDITDTARADLGDIQCAARSVLRIFDSLLFLTRVTAQGAREIKPVDLPAVLDAVATEATDEARPGEQVTWTLAPDLPRVVPIDTPALRVMLKQILGSAGDAGVRDLGVTVARAGADLSFVVAGGSPVVVAGTPLELGLSLVSELAIIEGAQMVCADDGDFAVTLTFAGVDATARGELAFTAGGEAAMMRG